jgi:hypothetical protein
MTTETQDRKETNKPKYYAYHVTEAKGEGQKARWHQIGAYFTHTKGDGGTLVLDLLPVGFTGKIVLRAPKSDE